MNDLNELSELGGAILMIAICAVIFFVGFVSGVSINKNEDTVGRAYLAPCINQGYTEKRCFEFAMKELKGEEK